MPPLTKVKLQQIWNRAPGGNSGSRIVWLWHAIAFVALVWYLLKAKTPPPWTSDIHLPKPHGFSEYLKAGLWRGAWFHLVVSSLILGTVKWWSAAVVPKLEMKLAREVPRYVWFWPAMALIVVVALLSRLPRMEMSYWGDEGWALRHYVLGEWVPKDDKNMQGELEFKPVTWSHVFFDDRTGGNHFLFSICQKLTLNTWRWFKELPDYAFDESISRLPPLIAGVFSIVAIALFMRWLGRPAAGLLAALYLTLHPWHIRYSTEGRGYVMMLLFFILAVWALFWALRSGRWRAWITYGVMQFLAIYSWKVATLPFLEMDGLAAIWLLIRSEGSFRVRLASLGKLVVTGASMSALFVLLYATPSLQHPRALERLQHTGKPMDAIWLGNSLCGLLVGTPWHRSSPDNPTEVPVSEALAQSPLSTGAGIVSMLGLLALGAWRLSRTDPKQLLMWSAIAGGAVMGAAVFKWVIKIEWIFWYSFFVILPLAVLFGKGAGWLLAEGLAEAKQARGKICLGLAVLLPFLADRVALPQIRLMDSQPYESNREAFQLTRGQHEPWNFAGTSKIRTCYLWRHITLYDPRADRYVRDAATLQTLMSETDADDGELYYVVGQRGLFRTLQKDVMAILANPTLFDHKATLWAEEDIHTLEVYHYRKKRPAG
ncbi:MAG: glycosyltransferase family 39 protein [Verrucomicrobiaceae bacterium]|nr:glycosyltransferase family 39 protein [Verrucomicrobiaceae bacterium]